MSTLSIMSTKSVRMSEDTYKKLVEIAGKLQAESKKPLSIEDAIKYLLRTRISDLVGSWDVTDEEVDEIENSLKRRWKTWKSSA